MPTLIQANTAMWYNMMHLYTFPVDLVAGFWRGTF